METKTIYTKPETVWVGFINKKDLKFCSVYTISRKNPQNTITFKGELYRIVNTEWKCYIKESEYKQLFEND